jgi:hypothetical protein
VLWNTVYLERATRALRQSMIELGVIVSDGLSAGAD